MTAPPYDREEIERTWDLALANAPDDAQIGRATELRALRMHRWAEKVALCGTRPGAVGPCGNRFCPRCAAFRAANNAESCGRRVSMMRNPWALILTIIVARDAKRERGSTGDRLGATLAHFTTSLSRLRHRKVGCCLVAGAGSMEPKLTTEGDCWNVHAHLIVDRREPFDVAALNAAWQSIVLRTSVSVKRRPAVCARIRACSFLKTTDPHVEHASAEHLVRYNTKARGVCPGVGELALDALDELIPALHGRRTVIAWGARPKVIKEASAQPASAPAE